MAYHKTITVDGIAVNFNFASKKDADEAKNLEDSAREMIAFARNKYNKNGAKEE